MVTANNQSADIVEALELGANDYVAKPVEFAVALARIKAQVERKRAGEALAVANAALNRANEQLEQRVSERTARLTEANDRLRNEVTARESFEAQNQYLAYHDALTGLGNRLLFREELQRALAEGARPGNLGHSVRRSRRIQRRQRRPWPFHRRRAAEDARQPHGQRPR